MHSHYQLLRQEQDSSHLGEKIYRFEEEKQGQQDLSQKGCDFGHQVIDEYLGHDVLETKQMDLRCVDGVSGSQSANLDQGCDMVELMRPENQLENQESDLDQGMREPESHTDIQSEESAIDFFECIDQDDDSLEQNSREDLGFTGTKLDEYNLEYYLGIIQRPLYERSYDSFHDEQIYGDASPDDFIIQRSIVLNELRAQNQAEMIESVNVQMKEN